MFFVGLFEALITLMGVILVWRTLVATRRAAIAAENAVNEAKNTSKVSREIGEAQVRAYLEIVEVRVSFVKWPPNPVPHDDYVLVPKFKISVENTGNSPALEFRWATTMIYGSELWDTLGKERGDPDLDSFVDHNLQIRERTIIAARQRRDLSYVMADGFISDHLAIDDHGRLYRLLWQQRPSWQQLDSEQFEDEVGDILRISATIRTKFRDVFNNDIVDTVHYVADFEKGMDRTSTEVIARRDPQPKKL
jgi:hypothetical protein